MRVRLRSSCLRVALSVLGRVFPGRQTVTVSLVPYTYADTTPAMQKEEVSPGRQRRTKPKRPSRCCGRLSRVVRSRCVAAGDTGGTVTESPEPTDPRRIVGSVNSVARGSRQCPRPPAGGPGHAPGATTHGCTPSLLLMRRFRMVSRALVALLALANLLSLLDLGLTLIALRLGAAEAN